NVMLINHFHRANADLWKHRLALVVEGPGADAAIGQRRLIADAAYRGLVEVVVVVVERVVVQRRRVRRAGREAGLGWRWRRKRRQRGLSRLGSGAHGRAGVDEGSRLLDREDLAAAGQ